MVWGHAVWLSDGLGKISCDNSGVGRGATRGGHRGDMTPALFGLWDMVWSVPTPLLDGPTVHSPIDSAGHQSVAQWLTAA